ncbi:MAG: DUF4301 family protein, partial [Bacteroidota bacterium]
MFTDADKEQIAKRGSSVEGVTKQIQNFVDGFPPLQLMKPATEGHGVIVTDKAEQDRLVKQYEGLSADKTIYKFVPASGAASRMFKALFAFMGSYSGTDEEYEKFSSGEAHTDVFHFFKHIHDFAFYDDLKEAFRADNLSLEEAHLRRRYTDILRALLTSDGLSYGELPKGLLKFHQYEAGGRTPTEEHLVEGAHYAKGSDQVVRLHFTVSPEHRTKFEQHIESVKGKFEEQFGVTYKVSFSEQKPATDTIAVDLENEPFRNGDGSLLFRPAGHGALIANLDEIHGDLVFIKNVDNVVPDHLKGETYVFKKVIAGKLLEIQQKTFDYLNKIDNGWSDDLESELVDFCQNELNIELPEVYSHKSSDEKRDFIHQKLNRPIRVSGMVGNIGDPGGGP